MKSLLTVLGILVLVTGSILHTLSFDAEQAIFLKASKSVVRVKTDVSGLGGGYGTGFAISTQTRDLVFITNAHVCMSNDSIVTHTLQSKNSQFDHKARIIKMNEVYDLCALETESVLKPGTFIPLKIHGDRSPHGERSFVVGHPEGEDLQPSSGVVISYGNRISTFWDSVLISNRVYPGNSGSPILNLDGEVIGVTEAASTRTNQGYGIPAEYLELFIMDL